MKILVEEGHKGGVGGWGWEGGVLNDSALDLSKIQIRIDRDSSS